MSSRGPSRDLQLGAAVLARGDRHLEGGQAEQFAGQVPQSRSQCGSPAADGCAAAVRMRAFRFGQHRPRGGQQSLVQIQGHLPDQERVVRRGAPGSGPLRTSSGFHGRHGSMVAPGPCRPRPPKWREPGSDGAWVARTTNLGPAPTAHGGACGRRNLRSGLPVTLRGVLDAVLPDPALSHAVASAGVASLELSAPPALRPFVAAALADASHGGAGRPVLAVTATGRDAEDLVEALRCVLPAGRGLGYPSWETLPHERLSPRADTVGRRLAVLRRPRPPEPADAGTGAAAGRGRAGALACCSRRCPASATWSRSSCSAGDAGRELDRRSSPALVAAGYARTELVEKRGDFAVRGGILDVFPPTEEHPLRVEFWGDEVEEIRYFKVADQRSLEIAGARAVGAAVPRAAADRRRPGAGRARWPSSTPSWPSCSTRSAGARRSRAWSRWRRCWSTSCSWC